VNAGETFHMGHPGSTQKHLYVALTDPDSSGRLAIANVTSQGQDKDQSCVLSVGDHPFIKWESVMNYADAFMTNEALLRTALRSGLAEPDAAVTPQVLAKIRKGAVASPHTEAGVKAAVQTALGRQ
jgi:CMP-2-keto-3-deoxyoctulosonic acid synthetase